MRKILLAGLVLAVLVSLGLAAAGGRGILYQAIYHATGTGAVDRTAQSKLGDTIGVRDFGAVGDGVTDDTAAVAAAVTNMVAGGKRLFFPAGTYIVGATAFSALAAGVSNISIRGEGMERTILQAASPACATVFDITTANVYFQRLEIADLTLVGCGPTDVNGGHGLHISTGNTSTQPNQLYIHDLGIRDCAGKGLYIEELFTSRVVNVMVNNCGDNLFDVRGGNTTTLQSTYAQTVRTGRVGYRVHVGNLVMISVNGINNTWGASNQDQADWGVFGDELLTAWAQTTAYTLGQLRSANGMEFEVTTAGTSSGSGTGPASISTDITDGTVHWRHVGSADASNLFVNATFIGCNVEDPTRHGIRLKSGSSVNLFSNTFVPPPGAGAASAGLIGLWVDTLTPQQDPIFMDAQSLANAGSYSQYDHGVLIHTSTNSTGSIVRIGGTTNAPSIYNRALALTYNSPSITVVPSGNSSGSAGFNALSFSKVEMAGAFAHARVTPTYGASVTIDPTLGDQFDITATNGTAFTINNPGAGGSNNVGCKAGQRIIVRIINTSGGALGVITWSSRYKMNAFTAPATANSRSVQFTYDGTNWIEERNDADVPN